MRPKYKNCLLVCHFSWKLPASLPFLVGHFPPSFHLLWLHSSFWFIYSYLYIYIHIYIYIYIYIISSVMHAFWLVLTYDLLEDRHIDDVIIKTFFKSSLYKTNRFQVAVCLFNNRSQSMSLTSSVIYYWTDAWQLGIYLTNRGCLSKTTSLNTRKGSGNLAPCL